MYEDGNTSIECKDMFRIGRCISDFLDIVIKNKSWHLSHEEITNIFRETCPNTKLVHLAYLLRSGYSVEKRRLVIGYVLPLFRTSEHYRETLQKIFIDACLMEPNNSILSYSFTSSYYHELMETKEVDAALFTTALRRNGSLLWLNEFLCTLMVRRFDKNNLEDSNYEMAIYLLKLKHQPQNGAISTVYQIFQLFYNRKQDYMEHFKEILRNPSSSKLVIENLQIFNQVFLEEVITAPHNLYVRKEYCKKFFTTKRDYVLNNELEEKAFNFFINYEGYSWEIDYLFSNFIRLKESAGDEFYEKHRHHFYEIFFTHWKEAIEKQEMLIELSKIDLKRTVDEMLNADPPIYLSCIFSKLKQATQIIEIFKTYSNEIEKKEQEILFCNLTHALKKVLIKHYNEKTKKFLLDMIDWMTPVYPKANELCQKILQN
ncbi:predicted protein [Naegleria gruberi]|uniref:Predicted protein n=1 Tax=Naegleria gruberi TaxID=5762 RepID=D2V848_NAEGR|nr:uncharacterized protein NAEGRDRAFT_65027 [Naegleria gruberi]EFC46982.1 predicted protein [Naegleria gruberi]|eukprot:XP_002679726.1 predicted protein [Naegleria gruberi strain NEG-M]